jgi:hypothetical protein
MPAVAFHLDGVITNTALLHHGTWKHGVEAVARDQLDFSVLSICLFPSHASTPDRRPN